jgi:6-phosphogluconolactonase/glucosamine-6-phosphate isomerase/deaminase
MVLVVGADKSTTLGAVLEGPTDQDRYPIQCLRAARHPVTWLADRAAAARLT